MTWKRIWDSVPEMGTQGRPGIDRAVDAIIIAEVVPQ
jgi:hypothetical protein